MEQQQTKIEINDLNLKPNKGYQNIWYWIKRTVFHYSTIEVELFNEELFLLAHKLNMSLDQLIEKMFRQYFKKYKTESK